MPLFMRWDIIDDLSIAQGLWNLREECGSSTCRAQRNVRISGGSGTTYGLEYLRPIPNDSRHRIGRALAPPDARRGPIDSRKRTDRSIPLGAEPDG
jgi:hypothetical protein